VPERRELADAVGRSRSPADAIVARLEADQRSVRETQDDSVDVPALVRRAKTNEPGAREALLERFLPLVNALARRYRADDLEHADLLQEGIIGLLQALERFDPERGVPFSAYATLWIRQALQHARSDFIRPFRLPPKALRQLSQLKTEHQRIYQAERRSAEITELAQRTGIDVAQARALAAVDAHVRSLDEPIETGAGELGSLGDLLEDRVSADIYEQVIDSVAGQQLRALLSRLTDRERDVIRARFGFDQSSQRLADIGARLGISAERVRQIEERGLSKLRQTTP
jgi:RNA polymerase sigma factor (sigma-70 family)